MVEGTECFICGTRRPNSIETHHIVPRRYGGSDAPENLVNLCSNCHSAIEKLYDDSFYDRLGIDEAEISGEGAVDTAGTKVPAQRTKDRSYPQNPAHITREKFGLEITFSQFFIYNPEQLISEEYPESDLLIQELKNIDLETLRKHDRKFGELPDRRAALESVYPENTRLTPPVRIVRSRRTMDPTNTSKSPIRTSWFSRLHCGYCHTVYSEFEKADLAAHLRVEHRIEDPYESESDLVENESSILED